MLKLQLGDDLLNLLAGERGRSGVTHLGNPVIAGFPRLWDGGLAGQPRNHEQAAPYTEELLADQSNSHKRPPFFALDRTTPFNRRLEAAHRSPSLASYLTGRKP